MCVFPMSVCFRVKQTGETFGEKKKKRKKKPRATVSGSAQSGDRGRVNKLVVSRLLSTLPL